MRLEILTSERKPIRDAIKKKRIGDLERIQEIAEDRAIIHALEYLKRRLINGSHSRNTRERNKKLDARKKKINDATKKNAVRFHRVWTNDEDYVVMSSSETDEEIARKIGRTLKALNSRRYVIRMMNKL